jgi:hypothetical protein
MSNGLRSRLGLADKEATTNDSEKQYRLNVYPNVPDRNEVSDKQEPFPGYDAVTVGNIRVGAVDAVNRVRHIRF